MQARAAAGSAPPAIERLGPAPKKKPPEGGFFCRKQKITSSRELQERQQEQLRALRPVPKRRQRGLEREPVRQQVPERGPEPVRIPSCHKRPERLQQR
jgi:hypothetical protein